MTADLAAVKLTLELARRGFRGSIKGCVLSSLVAWTQDVGIERMAQAIENDPGWLICPNARWFSWSGKVLIAPTGR